MLWIFLWLLSALTIVCTVAGFFGRNGWLCELASHFRSQYFVLLTASALLFFAAHRASEAILAGLFALINASCLIPLYARNPADHDAHRTFRACVINVNAVSRAYGKVLDYLRTIDPDFLVLVEVTDAWTRALQTLRTTHPFWHGLSSDDGYGIALISRLSVTHVEIRTIGAAGFPSLIARLDLNGQPLTLIGTHPPAPSSRTRLRFRNDQLAALAQFVRTQESSVMILGDLNTTCWSPFFRDLLRQSGLRDSQRGYGVQPTWPTAFPPLGIPIDHCLVSPRLTIHHRSVGPSLGSDHYPVVIEFSLETPKPHQNPTKSP